jgi:hypothetical protein
MNSNIPDFAAHSKLHPEGRVFNDDLLTNPGDLEYAKSQFPEAFHLLDHPDLRSTFATYEKAANKARAWVRWLGFLAVTSGMIALLSAATEPLWHHLKYEEALTVVFELCGLLAAAVAGGSLWLGPWRKRWLESRFMTERLRQWHFQLLVRKGSEIEALLGQPTPKSLETFKAERKKLFDGFLHDFVRKLDSRMDTLANDPDFAGDWLHQPPTNFSNNSRALGHVFEVYRRLRFNHQYDYATHKLSESTDRPIWQFLKWPLLRQESAIRGWGSFCFIAALLCSIVVIVNRYFEIKPSIAPYLGGATLSLAIVGIALRTIQDGLGITKDIERYRDYRGKVRRSLLCFEESIDQHKKLRLMEEMELAVVDELRGFLRTHRNAAFVL